MVISSGIMSGAGASTTAQKIDAPTRSDKIPLIITGFGRFNGVDDNPSMRIINELIAAEFQKQVPAFDCILETLEVSVEKCNAFFSELEEQINSSSNNSPMLMVHIGVDGKAETIKLEQTAYNDMTFRVPDERGFQPQNESIVSQYEFNEDKSSALPLREICTALNATLGCEGTVALSNDAGRFLCNYTYFQSIIYQENRCQPNNSVFVHVPPLTVIPQELQVALVQNIILSLCTYILAQNR